MKKLFIALFVVALCTACGGSSVDKSISQVEKALAKVEKNKGKMTEADWRNLEKELEAPLKVISEALESDKVGLVGKMKIVAVTAKWATVLAEAGISDLEKRTGVKRENWGSELEKAAKEIEKEVEKASKESKDGDKSKEIEKAIENLQQNDLVKELMKTAKELEKAKPE